MDIGICARVSANAGVIRSDELLDLGVSPVRIRSLVKRGDLIRLRRGVYTTREVWESLDPYVGRPLLRARAAIATMKRGWVLSHDSAAHAWGLPILRAEPDLVHITRPGFTNAWTEYGVRHHLARFASREVQSASGLPALDLARTAVDIARERGTVHGVVACDGAMNRGVRRADLEAAYAVMANWPGVRDARRAVDLADAGAETVLESLSRLLVLEAGIGDPETQFPVRTAEGVKWCDLRVGNHIVEADGMVKLLPVGEGGVATRDAALEARDERKRERLLRDCELGVSRLYWEDHFPPRRSAAIARLRREAAETERLYGAELHPHLAAEAARIRAQHPRRGSRPEPA